MKNTGNKSDSETLRQQVEELLKEKSEAKILELIEELAFQNEEKAKRVDELLIANKELAFRQEDLRKIASQVPGVVYQYLLRPDGTSCFPYASEAIREIYRVSPEQVREDASAVFANLHPDDLAVVAASIQASAQNLTPWQHEYRVKFSDGTIRLLYGNAVPQREVDGSVLWHGFITDITERNQSAEALKESEKRFRTVADNTYDWEYWTGVDGRIIYISPSCERISGYKPEEFLLDSSLLNKIVHPGDANLLKVHSENINSPQHRHEIYEFDFRILKKDGSVVHIGHLCRPVSDDKGNHEGRRISNRDITQRKQIEEELKLTSVRAELAARAGGVGIWDYDIVNDILLWDDQMFALYGITGKEFIGVYEAWQAGVHPDDKERGDKEIQMAILSEKEFDTEFRVVWPDNSIHNIRALAVVQHDDSGKALRMIGTNWDITELRKAEKEKLDDSESRYRSIFHGSPDGIMITDEETKMIMFANPTQCEMLGYTEDELKTMTIAGIHHADTLQETLAEFESLAQGKKTNGENIQCLRKNGEIFYADIASSFMTINGRKCLVGFFRDITKRRQAEEALHKSNAYLENLINYANTPIIVWDPQFHITRFNHAFEHLTGCNEAEVLGKSIDVLFPPSQVSHAMSLIHKTLSGERWETVEIEILHRDESIRTLLWNSATLFAPDGYTPTATIAQGYDITQRKQAEVSLKEALVKAEASNRLKTAFMNNISHEVRTPLNGIMGFGSLLTDPNLSTEERQQYNQFLKVSGNRLINTITDYMDISLVASGNIDARLKPVNVHDLMKELQAKFQDSCNIKNLALNLTIPGEQERFMLNTDAELLRKIISCLLDNAIKFTSLGSITFGYSVKSNAIGFFVIDTGIGIAPEAQERIFEPFMQENITNTRGHEGSGLGLSIIKGFLMLLGSEIRLESVKGHGASFFFSLPMEPGSTEENEPIAPPVRQAEIIRPVVLVAEDDLSNDLYMEIILKSFASVVFKSANGKEAVAMCQLHPEISLVLMDLKMPVMDGFEATRQIKSFRKELPIIAITAYAFSKDKKKALEIGCDDFLSKPVSKHDLLEKFKKFGFLE